MQDVENNMDDLFRKAARAYPLKDGRDDWDKIAPLLMDSPVFSVPAQQGLSLKRQSSLFLFLLLFLFVTGIATADTWYTGGKADLYQPLEKKLLIDAKSDAADINQQSVRSLHNNHGVIHTVNIPSPEPLVIKNNKKDLSEKSFIKKIHIGFAGNVHVAPEEKLQVNALHEDAGVADMVNTEVTQPDSLTGLVMENKATPVQQVVHNSKNIDTAGGQAVSSKKCIKKQPDIYWGIVFGPSFNQVKNQGLKKPGYDIGLLAGYQINNRLSVETGVLFEKKYYFSNGKYFDMAKASSGMPAGMKVISLDGSCAVFEVPLKVKYNLYGKGHLHFYAAAGISAYILTNEYNKYHAVINGSQQDISGTYSNSSRYGAAALNISGGYENRVGKYARVRVEPYVQIPLKGIGVGSLPVMTAGLHIGFTRFVF
jgi:hypothetical protein